MRNKTGTDTYLISDPLAEWKKNTERFAFSKKHCPCFIPFI